MQDHGPLSMTIQPEAKFEDQILSESIVEVQSHVAGDQLSLDCFADSIGFGVYFKLPVDILQVCLYRFARYEKFIGDHRVGLSLHE